MPKNKLSQEELIFLLETTARQLDKTIEILKRASPDNFPTANTVETLVKTTRMIVAELEPSSMPKAVSPTSHEEITEEWDKLTGSEVSEPSSIPIANFGVFTGFKTWWDSFLRVFRLVLPSNWNKNLSNLAIAVIVAGTLIILSFVSFLLFPRLLTPLAENPSVISKPKSVAISPPLKSPKTPQATEMISPPEPRFTPEQNLLKAIRHDIVDLTNQYPEELIGLIEANFKASYLIVTLKKQWYQLTPKRQDKLASSIFIHSKHLNFRKLEMVDYQGNLIARSPVVGNKIVVFRR